MDQITQITSDPVQTQTVVLEDGSTFAITIAYVPQQYCWVITSLTYNTFTLQGFRIVTSPDMLYQYRNQIPFGLACLPNGPVRDPSQQQDFESGAFSLYVLSAAEVNQYASLLAGETV